MLLLLAGVNDRFPRSGQTRNGGNPGRHAFPPEDSRMKLAIVHDWLTGMRGGEKCLEVLCRRFPQAELFTLVHNPGAASDTIEAMRIRTSVLQRFPGATRHYRYLLPLMPWAIERLQIPEDVDLVVSFSHAVAKSIQPPPGVPHLCYCFTPMRYAWHLRQDYFGEAEPADRREETALPDTSVHSLRVRGPIELARQLVLDRIRDWDRETSDRVTHFVASSHTVARRLAECYGRSCRVIYPPVDTEFFTPAEVPREDFYLCVSALVPYKRIELAIEACNRLGRRLVVIGAGPEQQRLQQLAGPTVELLGWQPDEVIRDHYRRCRALLFPGREDFGLVPLEAQACGAGVIALRSDGATETVLAPTARQSGTGMFFDEQSSAALMNTIGLWENMSQPYSPQLAREQAEHFATRHFERQLLDYIHELVPAKTAVGI